MFLQDNSCHFQCRYVDEAPILLLFIFISVETLHSRSCYGFPLKAIKMFLTVDTLEIMQFWNIPFVNSEPSS